MVNTGSIDRYISLWGQKYFVHQGDKYLRPTLPKTAVTNRQRSDLYDRPKLIFAKIAKQFEGFVDDRGEYGALNVNCAHSPSGKWTIRALAAYCHSSTFHFLYSCLFDPLRMAGGYLPFQGPLLRAMRVPSSTSGDKRLDELAEATLEAAEAKDEARLLTLEAEIDQIVYELFELTPQEIALIENSTL